MIQGLQIVSVCRFAGLLAAAATLGLSTAALAQPLPPTPLSATGGSAFQYDLSSGAPDQVSYVSGSLPDGLIFGDSRNTPAWTPRIIGTPYRAGVYDFTLGVAACTNFGCGAPVVTAYEMTVTAAPQTILPDAQAGLPYSQGGPTGPAMVSQAAGDPPNGVVFSNNGSTWTLAGTPTAVGTYSVFIRSTNLNLNCLPVCPSTVREYLITVAPPPAPVPTLTEWAMVILGLLLALGAMIHLHRRHPAT